MTSTPSLSGPNRPCPAVLGLFLVLATLSVYLPVVWFDFVCYDDPDYITNNPPVQAGMTLSSINWAFTQFHAANWHPATWLSHMLDYQVYGRNPTGHHLTNLMFHIANTLLLFGFLRYLTSATWRSAFVAAFFAVHPLHVESVAWLSERKDVLSTFCGLLSLWCYARYAREQETARRSRESPADSLSPAQAPLKPRAATLFYWLALAFFALGLMSKPMLVTWPFVMLLLDVWPIRRSDFLSPLGMNWRRLIAEKTPFFVVSAASCVITVVVQQAGGAMAPLQQVGLGLRILNALVSYLVYALKVFWPKGLAVVYPYLAQPPIAEVLLAGFFLSAITVLVILQRRNKPYLLVGWFWYLGTLVPVIGLVQVGNQPMADRYTYVPAIGLFLMAAWAVADYVGESVRLRLLAGVASTMAIGACLVLAQRQLMYWQNSETLFRHAITVAPRNHIAYNNLGLYFAELHEAEQALKSYRVSLAINPGYQQAWNNLACVLIDQGRFDEAITNCETALRLVPNFPEAHNNLGTALLKRGQLQGAITQFSQALRLRPAYAQAHYNLANAMTGSGQNAAAAEHYLAAVRLNPQWAEAHNNLGFVLAQQGRLAEAIGEFRTALVEAPQMWEAHFGLAAACAAAGKADEASQAAAKAYGIAQAAGDRERAEKCRTLLEALKPGQRSGERSAKVEPAPTTPQ